MTPRIFRENPGDHTPVAARASPAAVIEQQVRRRVLRWFSRHGLLDPDDARDMLAWANGGFSLDASVCIAGHDRAGLERLLRDFARPRFAVRLTGYSRQSVVHYQGQLLAAKRPSTPRSAAARDRRTVTTQSGRWPRDQERRQFN